MNIMFKSAKEISITPRGTSLAPTRSISCWNKHANSEQGEQTAVALCLTIHIIPESFVNVS